MMMTAHNMAALLITACVVGISCSVDTQELVKRDKHWCGKSLVQALQVLCNGVYQRPFKKANHLGLASQIEDYSEDSVMTDEVPLFPFRFQRFPVEDHLSRQGLRVRRGVSDECCKKGCTVAVLETYCAG